MLIDTVSKGGNLLMNVGPTARGTFDERALSALGVYADWMKLHSRAIYGCTQSTFTAPTDVRYTQNSNTLYAHIFAWPFKALHLEGLAGKVRYAQLLNDGSEIRFKDGLAVEHSNLESDGASDMLTLQLPVQKPNVIVPVIELFLK